MTTLQLLIVCLTALGVCVTALGIASIVSTPAEVEVESTSGRVGAEVTVHTRMPDDQTLRGTVLSESDALLRLAGVRYITAAGEHPINGTVTVPQRNVAWVQEDEPPEAVT